MKTKAILGTVVLMGTLFYTPAYGDRKERRTPEKPVGTLPAQQRLGLEFAERPESEEGCVVGKGQVIQRVLENSQAESVGLRPGMHITQISGSDINTLNDVGYALLFVRSDTPV